MVRIAVKYNVARFEVLTVELLKAEVFWDVMLCKLVTAAYILKYHTAFIFRFQQFSYHNSWTP